MVPIYAPFYFAVCEVSTLPLCLIEVMKTNPKLRAGWPRLDKGNRLLFSITFVLTRFFGFLVWNIPVWRVGMLWLKSDWATKRAFSEPNNLIDLKYMLVANLVLSGLQCLWTVLVLKMVYRTIFGDERRRRNQKVKNSPAPTHTFASRRLK